jgi:hypothetical protein
MKGFILAIAFVIALPLAAFAHSSCLHCPLYMNSDGTLVASAPGLSRAGIPYIGSLGNIGGTLTGNNAGLTLTGSYLTEVRGISGADLGTVTLTTGTFYGNLQTGGGWFSGGSLVVTLNPGVLGGKLSGGGILYNGGFGAVSLSWTPVIGDPGFYILSGVAGGTLPNGTSGQAFVFEEFSGSFNSSGMFTGTVVGGSIEVNPEPGTLGLFVTGLIGMGGAIRRKMRSSL